MVRMDLFRSEEMNKVQLIIPSDSAHYTMTYLAEIGQLQFKDLNPGKSPFQRAYAAQAKRCGEMARKLRWFEDQIVKTDQTVVPRNLSEKELELDEVEIRLAELEVELLEINNNSEKLNRSHRELTELNLVLQRASMFFSSARSVADVQQRRAEIATATATDVGDVVDVDHRLLLEQEMPTNPSKQLRLGCIAGMLAKLKCMPFERILFRATRGNMYLKQASLADLVVDPITGEKVEKVVFVVFFAGERAQLKITKICEAFGANRYPFPEDASRQRQMKAEVATRLSEVQETLSAGTHHRNNILNSIGYSLDAWILMIRKEHAIYHTLNMLSMDVTRKCLVAEGWCPIKAKPEIQDALVRATASSQSQLSTIFHVMHTKESPPTFYETNKFTVAFQEIVDAYGVARYQEANPGCFTIVTFPFLFAVMFGDWGHGIVVLCAAIYLIWREKKFESQKLGDIMAMAFGGRYVILLMAIFSIYTGFIYNEFFSVPFYIWESAYDCADPSCSTASRSGLVKWSSLPYPFGLDPAWHGSRTELPFTNSLKMKMSILMGVSQMNLGVFLSWWNAAFNHSKLDIWYQFVPQLLFLNSLFGYLSMLILIKWIQGSKPDLYHVMIYMFLSPGEDLGENQLFWGQSYFQRLLVLVALVAVPWMLFPKPFKLKKLHKEKLQGRAYGVLGGSDTDSVDLEHEEEEFNFSEIFVHQMIHTIEFVLGAVSNTASYLRLWALRYSNPFMRLIGLLMFMIVTVGVLLIMESLSAFLHALRLHWVEFQNKFYVGDGYKFKPFSFKDILGTDLWTTQ